MRMCTTSLCLLESGSTKSMTTMEKTVEMKISVHMLGPFVMNKKT